MRRIFIILCLSIFLFVGDNISAQDRAPSCYLHPQDYFAGDIITKTIQAPYATTYTYYCAMGWSGAGGYCGIQAYPDGGRPYIFSIWDPPNGQAITAPYAHPDTEVVPFGGEGTGLRSMNFQVGWNTGQWYTLVARAWDVGSHTYFGYWSHDVSGSTWTHFVTMDYPVANARFDGNTWCFIEDWLGNGWNSREYYIKDGWKRRTNGSWFGMSTMTFTEVYPDAGCANYIDNYDAGVENGYYYLISGGATQPSFSNRTTVLNNIPPGSSPDKPAIVFSITDATIDSVAWDVPASSTPQFGYTIYVNSVEATYAIEPETRSATISADAGDNIEVVLEDLLGRTSSQSTTISDGAALTARWKLDETSGTVAVDEMDSYNGVYTNSPTLGVAGALNGYAVDFDGTDDYAACGNVPADNNITIVAWIKPNVLSGDMSIVGKNASLSFKSSGSELRFTTPGIRDHTSSGASLSAGIWQHVAVTYQEEATAGVKFYVNGSFISSADASAMTSNANSLDIARNQWGQYFDGSLDDVLIYNYALGDTEIADLYNSGPVNYASTDIPKNITDAGVSTLVVSGAGGTVTDLNLNLNILHDWVGDVTIILKSPTNTEITVVDRPGRTTSGWGFSSDDIICTLDDDAGPEVEDADPPTSGPYNPENALSGFIGEEINGVWELIIEDAYPGADHGTLITWSIDITN